MTLGQQPVLIGPEHQEEADQGGDHHVGLHCHVEAGEVEAVHVVDVGVAQLELPQLAGSIELILVQFQFVGWVRGKYRGGI